MPKDMTMNTTYLTPARTTTEIRAIIDNHACSKALSQEPGECHLEELEDLLAKLGYVDADGELTVSVEYVNPGITCEQVIGGIVCGLEDSGVPYGSDEEYDFSVGFEVA